MDVKLSTCKGYPVIAQALKGKVQEDLQLHKLNF